MSDLERAFTTYIGEFRRRGSSAASTVAIAEREGDPAHWVESVAHIRVGSVLLRLVLWGDGNPITEAPAKDEHAFSVELSPLAVIGGDDLRRIIKRVGARQTADRVATGALGFREEIYEILGDINRFYLIVVCRFKGEQGSDEVFDLTVHRLSEQAPELFVQ